MWRVGFILVALMLFARPAAAQRLLDNFVLAEEVTERKQVMSRPDGAPLAVSLDWFWREGHRDTKLAYETTTIGWLAGIALRVPGFRGLYYHVRGGSLAFGKDAFNGFLIAPIALGYWLSLPINRHFSFEARGVATLLQIEYMAGARQLAYPTQSSTSIGWGAEATLGVGVNLWRLSAIVGFSMGKDSRYLSFQQAGVSGGGSKEHAWTWIGGPSLTLRLNPTPDSPGEKAVL